MENLFKLLLILGIALFLLVAVLQRIGQPVSEESQAAMSRWLLPLCLLLAVAGLIRYWLQ